MTVSPLNRDLAIVVLTIGQFQKSATADRWVRELREEGTQVAAVFNADGMELSIGPSVSKAADHAMKRRAAGVYFEIATRYAEKVGGRIEQRATVEGCTEGAVSKTLVLAQYPDVPMRFDRVCRGFQAAILGELST